MPSPSTQGLPKDKDTFMNSMNTCQKWKGILNISIQKDVVDKTANDAGKQPGLLKKVSPYLNPNQWAMIYNSTVRSKMEYVSSVWMAASHRLADLKPSSDELSTL